MTDLNSLLVFAKVAEANSFSEAARQLKMPVSTVSRRIAELEDQLGVRLLERSTRRLRLTDIGAQVFEHAQRAAELADAVGSIASSHQTRLSGVLRLSAPPSLSDTLLAPMVGAFQSAHPEVRVQILVTERMVDHIAEGVDLVFRMGALKDSTLIARRILTFRHQLLASPAYLERCQAPERPQDLLQHRLLAFSRWRPESRWTFVHATTKEKETLTFQPYLAMNDYAGLAEALLAGTGIGELPPLVRPGLVRSDRLIEVMAPWRFPTYDLNVVHPGSRNIPLAVRAFKDFAAQLAPRLFPGMPV